VKVVAGAFSLEKDVFSIVIIVKFEYNPHKRTYLVTEHKGKLIIRKRGEVCETPHFVLVSNDVWR
jgi:hypothetical protein